MVDWRRGQGQSVMKLMRCSGLSEIYARLGGVRLPNMSTLRNFTLASQRSFLRKTNTVILT